MSTAYSDQGWGGYYDQTLDPTSSEGMGGLGMFVGDYGRVTTNDPAPAGDLRVRNGPGTEYQQIGGAEKGAVVEVLDGNAGADGSWAEIIFDGGQRWPAVQGYVKNTYLTPASGPQGPTPPAPWVNPPSTPVMPDVPYLPQPPQPQPSPAAPAAAAAKSNTVLYLALGAAGLAIVGGLYFAVK